MEERALREAFTQGKRTWPSIELELDWFLQHCKRVLGAAPEWDWHRFGTELYLCCACAQGDAEAMRVLEADTLPQVVKAISRIDSESEFIEEALQSLRTRLLVGPRPKIADYAARGPLVAWLSVAAARVALDAIRSRNARKLHHADLPDRLGQTDSNPLNDMVKSRYRDSFQQALKQAIHALPPRERNLLRLQLVGRCSIDQLGRMYLVHRATAARWLESARHRVFESVRQQMKKEHGNRFEEALEEGTFDSVMRDGFSTHSGLDASAIEVGAGESVSAAQSMLESADAKGEKRVVEHLSAPASRYRLADGVAVFGEGDVIGNRYFIERFLGRGAMGEVYLGLDQKLQHRVALKILAAELSDRVEYEQRLEREVILARRIVHGNVCRVYDVNVHKFADPLSAPVTYLTMEYLKGESLGTRVRRSPLSTAEARGVARQVLGALGAIHNAKILHRDLKSANIMLCGEGDKQRAVVMDFGLAVEMSEGISGRTPKGAFVGTPAYASPEQLRGSVLTPASDLYSLGVVLFEAIAGHPPFANHDDPLLAADSRCFEPVKWPEKVDTELRRLIETCLRPKRSARFQSAQAALHALEQTKKSRSSRTSRARRGSAYKFFPVELIDEIDQLTIERHRRAVRDDAITAKIRELVTHAARYKPPQTGDRLLGAQLVEVVGTGAFGDVWRADAGGGGEIAIKVFHANKLGFSIALHQFRRGLRAMRALEADPKRPDSVVRLLESDPSQTIFSMPFADKLDLSNALKPWPLESKLSLFREVCLAVQFAHSKGVLHRDIKPGNILITRDTRPVLADFDSCDFVQVKTMSAQPGGTLLFAAPEQLDGSVSRDVRSDVYSLGRLLHYLLIERDPPLRIDNEPPLEDLDHHPRAIVHLIRRSTMRQLGRRWQSVDELLGELGRSEAELSARDVALGCAQRPATLGEPAPAMPHTAARRVFLSYVRTDEARVNRVAHRLEAEGIPVWIDSQSLELGQRWKDEIGAAIRDAALFVALFSKDGLSQERSYMREELALAVQEARLRPRHRTWFVPVLLDDVPLPEGQLWPGESIGDLQAARLYVDWDAGIEALISVLNEHLR